jgi:citrate/tricarballylate utilization protein
MPETDAPPETDALIEARREMEICNACRYCEGFCAVFPAMERRRTFSAGDLSYLANLCHNCRACFHACPYAPPHEFALNLPRALAELRAETYAEHAWPKPLSVLFRRNGTVASLAAAIGAALVIAVTLLLVAPRTLYIAHGGPRAFYAVIPWGVLAGLAGAAFVLALVALGIATRGFWRATGGGGAGGPAALAATHDVLTLRNLGGGGYGCNDRGEAFSMTRRRLHHAAFYGFLLCFAATCAATIAADLFGRPAPYPFFSAPVLLGTVGGVLLTIGTGGLAWLKIVEDRAPTAPGLLGADFSLLLILALVAVSGLLLLAFRASGAMGVLLALHFGLVLAFFLLLPFSKMVHAPFRAAALLRNAQEARVR